MSGGREAMQKLRMTSLIEVEEKYLNIQPLCHYIPLSQPSKGKCNSKGVAWYIHCIFLGFIHLYTAKVIRKIFLLHFLTVSLGK